MSVSFLPLRTVVLGTAVAIASIVSSPAQAFSDDEARRAILELREQFKQFSDQSRSIHLQQSDRIEMLQQELATLRGQVEQLNWQSNLQQRASQDQSGGHTTHVADPQEQAAYEGPMGLFRSGKYKEAAGSFGQFLDAYPNSQLAAEARFYQGSSLYASKDFKGSVQGLQEMLRLTPKDPRAPDALLVMAASQIELNDLNGAKASLQRIIKDYPDSSAAETAKSRLQLL
ncbi:tol-pal system protein YbgF [Pusillimonas sp. ANT_WB101]|uniref:tol-pal system protein YbgF n=1 Tax=Pusillimonas sp. ANT_WB101 TaxID=2597356 RepID=UPI0011EF1E7C|nr:tol-pal system protein YbgF [Pusillimonas sp. ANT_WB101]KAA0890583.1 tol-pal system protein YbgF [Pusillimonas sp. ANT_WB101]